MQTPHTLFDTNGRPIKLGAKIAQGGEGSVYALADNPALVAKIYHPSRIPDASRRAKLQAMVAGSTPRLTQLAAWPTGLLLTGGDGLPAGFLMQRLAGFVEIHALYTPKTRLVEFPHATWEFLIHAAKNVAIAMRIVHDHGHIIGDVSHGNIFVGRTALVRLIDCDSFQIRCGDTVFPCDVGVATHTPPELQGTSFAAAPRTRNHDLFGLAVVIFQLLFLGRHPFSGVYLGPGEMPLEAAIKSHRFAYAKDAARRQMRPPPGGLSLALVSREVRTLFERAFGPAGDSADGRPGTIEWIKALTALESGLHPCHVHPEHVYWKGLAQCPWCAYEAASGKPMFLIARTVGSSDFDLDQIVAQLQAMTTPKPPPAFGAPLPGPDPRFGRARAGHWNRVAASIAAGAAVAGLASAPTLNAFAPEITLAAIATAFALGRRWPARRLRAEARRALDEADAVVKALQSPWIDMLRQFDALRLNLETDIATYRRLPERRTQEIRRVAQRREEAERLNFLDRHRIANYAIPGVGPNKRTQLQSLGIRTARDIVAADLAAIPGFGPATVNHLLQWRRRIEARFRFDPAEGVDPEIVRSIDAEAAKAAESLRLRLQQGAYRLRLAADQIDAERPFLCERLRRPLADLALARANLDAVR
jgi:DNA-binding helix-hairpin-helix protein with protein kinase domain